MKYFIIQKNYYRDDVKYIKSYRLLVDWGQLKYLGIMGVFFHITTILLSLPTKIALELLRDGELKDLVSHGVFMKIA